MPVVGNLPPGDLHVCVSRGQRRLRAEVYSWSLSDPLPTIPIALKLGDADTMLDLQQACSAVYQRTRYDLSIDYQQPLEETTFHDRHSSSLATGRSNTGRR